MKGGVGFGDDPNLQDIVYSYAPKQKTRKLSQLTSSMNRSYRKDKRVAIAKIRNLVRMRNLKKDPLLIRSEYYQKLLQSRSFVFALLKEKGINLRYFLEFIPDKFKNDNDIILEATKNDFYNLIYAPFELRNDNAFLLKVIKNCQNISFDDMEVVFNYDLLVQLSEEEGVDLERILETTSMPNHMVNIDNMDIMMELVKKDGLALVFANSELKQSHDLCFAAVKNNPLALKFAFIFQNDPEIVFDVVSSNGLALAGASDQLRDDRDIVLAAVKNDGMALKYASRRLQKDKEIALKAVENNIGVLQFFTVKFRKSLGYYK